MFTLWKTRVEHLYCRKRYIFGHTKQVWYMACLYTPASSARNIFLHEEICMESYPQSTPLYANNFRTFSFYYVCSIFYTRAYSYVAYTCQIDLQRFAYKKRYSSTLCCVYAIIRGRFYLLFLSSRYTYRII